MVFVYGDGGCVGGAGNEEGVAENNICADLILV